MRQPLLQGEGSFQEYQLNIDYPSDGHYQPLSQFSLSQAICSGADTHPSLDILLVLQALVPHEGSQARRCDSDSQSILEWLGI